jgi:TolB-like protein/Tfp pilus assembly protein PilF
MSAERLEFGPFAIDTANGAVTREGKPVALGGRGIALLAALADADGVVSKEELMAAVWPGTIVEEGNLSVQIAALRKALGRRPDGGDWIATVPRVGYRLVRGPSRLPEPTAVGLPTLAVLPFQNLSGDPEQDYFADGVVDELIAALSRFRSFAVIARGTSFAYKGRTVDARQVSKELGVIYLVEGSVRRSGGRLRLFAQLVDGAVGASLWAQTFEGSVDEVFEFQDRITTAVAAVVEPFIQRAELDRSRRDRPGSLAAYDLFLRAVAKIYTFTPETNGEAVELLTQAIEIEPENGVYMGFLAWALEHRTTMNWPRYREDDVERCLRLAHEAVELARDDARVLAHCGLAMQLMGQEYDAGLHLATRAVELNPNDVVALLNAGIAELLAGDLENAVALLTRAIAIQPNDSHEAMGAIGSVYLGQGRYEDALEMAKKSHALNRRYIPTHWNLVASLALLGRIDEARAALAELLALVPDLTIKRFSAVAKNRNPARDADVIAGLRLAGLPEA